MIDTVRLPHAKYALSPLNYSDLKFHFGGKEDTPISVQGILLILCSGVTFDGSQGAKCGARDSKFAATIAHQFHTSCAMCPGDNYVKLS